MRLFIAINLDDNMKQALMLTQEKMKQGKMHGRFTPAENMHLTLAFIGEYPNADEVLDALNDITFKPFTLTLDGTGCFGDLWWAGIKKDEGCDALKALVKKIRHALADAGIPFDRKSFSPHITLVRNATTFKPPVLSIHATGMVVDEFSLMRSDFGKNGVVYTEMGIIACQY